MGSKLTLGKTSDASRSVLSAVLSVAPRETTLILRGRIIFPTANLMFLEDYHRLRSVVLIEVLGGWGSGLNVKRNATEAKPKIAWVLR